MLWINIVVPLRPDYWGAGVEMPQVERAGRLHLDRLQDWAREKWPDAVVTGWLALPEELDDPERKSYARDEQQVQGDILQALKRRMAATWLADFNDANKRPSG